MEGGSSAGVFVDQKRLRYLSQGSMTVQQCLGEREGGGGGGDHSQLQRGLSLQ